MPRLSRSAFAGMLPIGEIHEVPAVYKTTADLLLEGVDLSRVVKMDAHNEVKGEPVVPVGVKLIELDQITVNRAIGMGMNVVQGSILELPIPDGSMDLVIDCSTIDHVSPSVMGKAIREYYRVLNIGGRLLIFAWCSGDGKKLEKSIRDGEQPYGPNHQFYFDETELTARLLEKFNPISSTMFGIEPFMMRYVMEKVA